MARSLSKQLNWLFGQLATLLLSVAQHSSSKALTVVLIALLHPKEKSYYVYFYVSITYMLV